MCSLQFMSLLMVTPRYLAVLTVSVHVVRTGVPGVSCCGSLAVMCISLGGRPYPIISPTKQTGWGLVVVGSGHRGRSPLCMWLCYPQRDEFGLSRCQEGHWCKWGTSRVPARCPLVVHQTGRWQTRNGHCWPPLPAFCYSGSQRSICWFPLGCRTGWACGSRDYD